MFFSKKNSVIVPFEYTNPDCFQDLAEQVHALKEHYQLSLLSEGIDRFRNKGKLGWASLVFETPRKGALVRAFPELISLEVPFFVFIDPDYVGLNRLPVQEELSLYREHYSDLFTQTDYEAWLQRSRLMPEETDLFLKECRKKLGPLPIDKIDPLSFFATWGKIMELPAQLIDFGVSLSCEIKSKQFLEEKLIFMSQQLKRRPQIIRAPVSGFSEEELKILQQCNVRAVVGHEVAAVEKKSPLTHLPIWKLT